MRPTGTAGPATKRWPISAGVARGASLATVMVSLFPLGPPAAAQDVQNDKAELLFHIAQFIEWPSQLSKQNQFTFAILGEDELASVLAATMSQKSINGKSIFVRCIRRPADARDCHILFIAGSDEKRIPEVLNALRGTSVLTVADTVGFAAQGGMVDFLLEDSKVRFEINREQAKRARLKISAKLLALAQIVVHQEP